MNRIRFRETRKLIFPIILSFALSAVNAQNYTALKGGTVIQTHSKGTIENAIVLIKDSLIYKVGKSGQVAIPAGAKVIDCKGKYIIPGMIDAHIHFFQSGGLYTRPDAIDLRHRVDYKDEELKWIKDNLDDVFKRYIRCGITTVYDLGGPMWNFDVRAYATKTTLAPRVFLSGPLIASYQPDALTTEDPPIIKVNSIADAKLLVQKQLEKNTDFIKIWYVVGRGIKGEEFEPIVKAIIDESHAHNKPVMVHAYELNESVKRALKAGADVLVHSVRDKPIDAEFIKLCKKNNVEYIPTLWVFESYNRTFTKQLNLLPQEILFGNPKIVGSLFEMYELEEKEIGERAKKMQSENKVIETNPILLENLKAAWEAGITIAAGTDAGNIGVIHGPSLFHEFLLMSKAGMPNRDILISATMGGAKVLGKENQLGSIESGKYADIVILNSNPDLDILNTSDISMVIKNGTLFKADTIIKNSPADLAQIQLNAYNSRNLESFLAVYADSIEAYTFPDNKLMFRGKEEMRSLYKSFFDRATLLHCQLMKRIEYENFIMDRESITTNIPGREHFEGQAIYQMANGKIVKVWFIK